MVSDWQIGPGELKQYQSTQEIRLERWPETRLELIAASTHF